MVFSLLLHVFGSISVFNLFSDLFCDLVISDRFPDHFGCLKGRFDPKFSSCGSFEQQVFRSMS